MNREMQAVTTASGVSEEEITGTRRTWDITRARVMYAWLRRNLGLPFSKIGAEINRDHSTVVYYMKVYRNYVTYNAEMQLLETQTMNIYDGHQQIN